MYKCLICETEYEPFISFGQNPIANGFLKEEQIPDEYFFELKVGFCPKCHMVQLAEHVDREKMFHENYAFFSQTSTRMVTHFKEFADYVMKTYCTDDDPFVAEIGSNDGIMLKNFKKAGIRHLGIEPSSNVADVARKAGINTISEFFDEDVAKKVVDEYGQANAFLAANVMCHIPYMHSVAKGIKHILKPKGVLIFEDPYMGDIIEKTSYDQVYDEHAFYFSVHSVNNLFDGYDMEVVGVQPQHTHGGSMRYIVAHKGAYDVSDAVLKQLKKEDDLGLDKKETYDKFRENCEKSRDDLMKLLNKLKDEGKRVVGYGATSKSTTVTSYCGIKPEHVEFISDTTPIKQGKLSPGAHIPVKHYDEFKNNYPEYALLFAWNHGEEIMEKEGAFKDSGGKFIVYVPEVKVVD